MNTPKAFISYSWDDDSHKKWVAMLATQLRDDGVETILDQWHAIPGDQLPEFMEREIRDNDYVLVVCTPKYREKSDSRQGGVGYEGDIMTAEVHTQRNHRKFIPVLAKGKWQESAPSWLKGKYYVDLSSEDRWSRNFSDLTATLLGNREKAPALKPASHRSAAENGSKIVSHTEPVKVIGVVVDEVTEPRLDGTPGSALYSVPFQLNCFPSSSWQEIFISKWNFPSNFSSMHRSRIASVQGDRIVLDGTTLEEVKQYHRNTLVLCVSEANEVEQQIMARESRAAELGRQRAEAHRDSVRKMAGELDFE